MLEEVVGWLEDLGSIWSAVKYQLLDRLACEISIMCEGKRLRQQLEVLTF